MAVYQISRIQIRRGQAGQGTGIPQLASGELAWALDTQELWIGNGSVAEGAPAVGNTKILTTNDLSTNGSLLGVLEYTYKTTDSSVTTGTNANSPVSRTMQTRLDDDVSVKEFGANGDGVLIDANDVTSGYTGTDNTQALQRAINQLYLNTSLKASSNNGARQRIKLRIPAGVYITTDTIYLPSYVNIEGDGPDKTIIYYNSATTVGGTITTLSSTIQYPSASNKFIGASISGTGIPANATIISVVPGVSLTLSAPATGSGTFTFNVVLAAPAFKTINDSSTIGSTPSSVIVNPSTTSGLTQPRNISVTELTIITASGKNTALHLDSAKDCFFSNVTLDGRWNNSLYNYSRGIFFSATSQSVTCEDNDFDDVDIENFSYAVTSYQDIINNELEALVISNCYQGVVLGWDVVAGVIASGSVGSSQEHGPRHTLIKNVKFENIKRHAVLIYRGTNNSFSEITLSNVGANGGTNLAGPATYPQIYFGDRSNNVNNITSDRPYDFSYQNYDLVYVPEVTGKSTYQLNEVLEKSIGDPGGFNHFIRLPVPTNAAGIPGGAILYTVDYLYNSSNYLFTRKGTLSLSVDVDNALVQLSDEYDYAGQDAILTNSTKLEFAAGFLDQTGATYTGAPGQEVYGIAIKYRNTWVGDAGIVRYSYRSII